MSEKREVYGVRQGQEELGRYATFIEAHDYCWPKKRDEYKAGNGELDPLRIPFEVYLLSTGKAIETL